MSMQRTIRRQIRRENPKGIPTVKLAKARRLERGLPELFGTIDDSGNVSVLNEDGCWVTRIDANVYPVGSHLSAKWEHAAGITLTREDAERVGVQVDEAS